MATGLAGELFASPAFATLAQWLAQLPGDRIPDCDDLNRLINGRIVNGQGMPLRCVLPSQTAEESYEARVWRRAELIVRTDNRHDVFNALAWMAFPQAKREINAQHVAHLGLTTGAVTPGQRNQSGRGTARDVLTQFDEDGLLVACASTRLAELLTNFQWKKLFWEHRDEVKLDMDFHIIGHALYDKMRNPFFGVTAKALILRVDKSYFARSTPQRLEILDTLAADRLRESGLLLSTRTLAPLPILGIPDWWPDNKRADYYDDTRQFRPGRNKLASSAKRVKLES